MTESQPRRASQLKVMQEAQTAILSNNEQNGKYVKTRKGSQAAVVYTAAVEIDENFYGNPSQAHKRTHSLYKDADTDINDMNNINTNENNSDSDGVTNDDDSDNDNDNNDNDNDDEYEPIQGTFLERMIDERRNSISKLTAFQQNRPSYKELEAKGILKVGDFDKDHGATLLEQLLADKKEREKQEIENDKENDKKENIFEQNHTKNESQQNNKEKHRKTGSIMGDFDIATQSLLEEYDKIKDDYTMCEQCKEKDRIIEQLRQEIQNLKRKLYKHRKKSSMALAKVNDLAKKAEIASRENETRIMKYENNDDNNNDNIYTEKDVEDAMGELIVQQIAAAIALFNMEFEKEFGKIDWENEEWDPNNTFDEDWANFNNGNNNKTIEWTPANADTLNNDNDNDRQMNMFNNNDDNQTKRRDSFEKDNNDDDEKNKEDKETPQGNDTDTQAQLLEDEEIAKRLQSTAGQQDTIEIRRNSKVLEYNINVSNSSDIFEFKYDESKNTTSKETPGGPNDNKETPGGPNDDDYGYTPGGPGDDYIADDVNIEELFADVNNKDINNDDDDDILIENDGKETKGALLDQQKEIDRLIEMNTSQADEINELHKKNNELQNENKQKIVEMENKMKGLSQRLIDFHEQVQTLTQQNMLLEKSKMELIAQTSIAMNEYRNTIRMLNDQNRQIYRK